MTKPQDRQTERVDQRRRRLGQAALGGSVVLAMFNPASVRAGYECTTVSASASFTPSHDGSVSTNCQGKSCYDWIQEWEDKWGIEEAADASGTGIQLDQATSDAERQSGDGGGQAATQSGGPPRDHGREKNERGWGDRNFYDAFGEPPMRAVSRLATTSSLAPAPPPTLYRLLKENPNDLTAYFIASMLNVQHHLIPSEILDLGTLKTFYRDVYRSGGFYTPYPGITWGPADVKAYLATTWGEGSIENLPGQV